MEKCGKISHGRWDASAHPEHKARLSSTFPVGNFLKSLLFALLRCPCFPLEYSILSVLP